MFSVPEGKGLIGGLATLVEKLRSLGIIFFAETRHAPMLTARRADRSFGNSGEFEKRAFVEVARASAGRIGDALWLQLGGREKRSEEE